MPATSAAAIIYPALAAATLYGAVYGLFKCLSPIGAAFLFHDDSFFYLRIAQNWTLGSPSTFDGIHTTNGYHPLYLWLLLGYSKAVPLVDHAGVFAVFVLDSILFVGGLLLMNTVLVHRYGLALRRLVLLDLLTVFLLGYNDFGIEVRLLFPLCWLFICLVDRMTPPTLWHSVAVGAVSSMLVLTRLDAWILVGCLVGIRTLLPLAYTGTWSRALQHGFASFLLPVLTLLTLASWNWVSFGHTMTISGWLKTGFPGSIETGWLTSANTGVKVRFLVTLAVAVGITLYCLIRNDLAKLLTDRHHQRHLLVFACGCYIVTYLSTLVLGVRGGVASWYFAIPLSLSLASVAILENDVAARSTARPTYRTLRQIAGILLVLAGSIFVLGKTRSVPLTVAAVNFSNEIQRAVAPGARVFQIDGSGRIGYFSRLAIINGDGLVNDFEYQKYLREGQLKEYLLARQVGYVVSNEFLGVPSLRLSIPLWNGDRVRWDLGELSPILEPVGKFAIFKVDRDTIRQSTVRTIPRGQP